jgi:hypothetical protein
MVATDGAGADVAPAVVGTSPTVVARSATGVFAAGAEAGAGALLAAGAGVLAGWSAAAASGSTSIDASSALAATMFAERKAVARVDIIYSIF